LNNESIRYFLEHASCTIRWTKEHGSKPVKKKRGGLFHAKGYDTAPWVNEYGYPTGGIPIKKGGR